MRSIELLSPARDANTARIAFDAGADAVYIGAPSHGARAAAVNSLDDIARTVDYAHRYDGRVYCTVNTIVYDSELCEVERLITDLYRIGVDALITQDMGILRLDIPPIALHASTQCDTRDVAKARFLQQVGFSQIVLARELSLSEIAAIHREVDVPLEAFVHGALCVSYSGDCHASWALKHRSANRGECAQICRLPWELRDAGDRLIKVAQGRHLLSLRDMNRSAHVAAMLQAGVSSFKIEGRLKNEAYVKNVTAAYRQILDDAIAGNPSLYRRSSLGTSRTDFTPDLSKSFNRGYTDYFLTDTQPTKASLSSMASPKSVGEPVGTVIGSSGRVITAHLTAKLANGDGIGYFTPDGEFRGFHLNRVSGNKLYAATDVNPPRGTVLRRNRDKAWDDTMASAKVERRIDVAMTLRQTGSHGIAIDLSTSGLRVSVGTDIELPEAKTPQAERRREALSKLGDTPYRLVSLTDSVGDRFIAASTLSALRRRAVEALDRAIRVNHHYDYRRTEDTEAPIPQGVTLTYHDNVANNLARKFYIEHGAKEIAPALEVIPGKPTAGTTVMTTRYCLRRELGACLKTPEGTALPDKLYLVNGPNRLSLTFDCANCRMRLSTQ